MSIELAESIVIKVLEYFNVTRVDLVKKGRKEEFVFIRFIAIGLINEFTDLSHTNIMELFNRDRILFYNSKRKLESIRKMPEIENAYSYLRLLCDPRNPKLPNHNKTFFNRYRRSYKWEIENTPKKKNDYKRSDEYKPVIVKNFETFKEAQNER